MPTAETSRSSAADRAAASRPAGDGDARVAVIGAGPGGLAAAILLAASGARVTIYERQPTVGGRTSRITETSPAGDAFHFDMGPTFFLMPYVLEEIFQAAGRDLHDYAELIPLDPMYRLIVGEPGAPDAEPTVIDATQDIEEMARRLAAIDPADGAAFKRFITHNRAKLAAAEPILRRPIRSLVDLARPDAMAAGLHIKPHLTVHGLLSKYFRHHAVQLAVSFQSKYLGMSPYDCPSLFTILPFIEYEYGIWHPKGGCNALMHAMAEVAQELGVEIVTGAKVDRLMFDDREPTRCTGLVVNGEERSCDHAVINADAAHALRTFIPESLRKRAGGRFTDDQLDRKRYSCSTYMLYLGVEGEVELPHHTIFVSSHYRQNLDDISLAGGLSDDPSCYVCNPSRIDPSLAPEGKSALYVLMPTPNMQPGKGAELDWSPGAGDRRRARETCMEQLRTRFGITDLDERIVCEREITPHEWGGMGIQFGATFNLAHNLGQMLHKRPHHKLQGFEGVWLVGGGTHPGSGLPVIFLSSQITASMLCDRLGLSYAGAGTQMDTRTGAARSRRLIERAAAARSADAGADAAAAQPAGV